MTGTKPALITTFYRIVAAFFTIIFQSAAIGLRRYATPAQFYVLRAAAQCRSSSAHTNCDFLFCLSPPSAAYIDIETKPPRIPNTA